MRFHGMGTKMNKALRCEIVDWVRRTVNNQVWVIEVVPRGKVSKILVLKGLKIDSAGLDTCLYMHKSGNKYIVVERYYSKWNYYMKSLYNSLGNFLVEIEVSFEFV